MSGLERYISPANRKVESDDVLIAKAKAEAEQIANRQGRTVIEMVRLPPTCDGIRLRFIVSDRSYANPMVWQSTCVEEGFRERRFREEMITRMREQLGKRVPDAVVTKTEVTITGPGIYRFEVHWS